MALMTIENDHTTIERRFTHFVIYPIKYMCGALFFNRWRHPDDINFDLNNNKYINIQKNFKLVGLIIINIYVDQIYK